MLADLVETLIDPANSGNAATYVAVVRARRAHGWVLGAAAAALILAVVHPSRIASRPRPATLSCLIAAAADLSDRRRVPNPAVQNQAAPAVVA